MFSKLPDPAIPYPRSEVSVSVAEAEEPAETAIELGFDVITTIGLRKAVTAIGLPVTVV